MKRLRPKIIKTAKILAFFTLFTGVFFYNLSSNKVGGVGHFTLEELQANAQTGGVEDCMNTCHDQGSANLERAWDRARDNMWDCVDDAFYGALIDPFIPDTGVPIVDIWTAIEDIIDNFQDLNQAYGCLDFMQSLMENDIDQITDIFDECTDEC